MMFLSYNKKIIPMTLSLISKYCNDKKGELDGYFAASKKRHAARESKLQLRYSSVKPQSLK